MITNTKNIYKLATSLAIGETIYKECDSIETATRCSSRINLPSRHSKKMAGMAFKCKVLLAIATPTQTEILLRVSRIA